MDTAIPYEATGRTGQKRRTREALIDAACRLIAAGTSPTVEEAAAAAAISRTTAYRYFRNQRELIAAAYPVVEARSLLGVRPPEGVAERLEVVIDELLRLTIEMEPALRTMLRLSLEADGRDRKELLLRRGRAIGWIAEALEPLRGRMPEQDIERLVYAIRSAAGIEAFVWLSDVACLPKEEAVNLMKWSARALLQAALRERNKTIPGETG